MKADGENIRKVTCPNCGHEQSVFYVRGAFCSGLFLKCKNNKCKKEFEIKI